MLRRGCVDDRMMAPCQSVPGRIGIPEVHCAEFALLDDLTCSKPAALVSPLRIVPRSSSRACEVPLLGIVVGMAVAAVREPVGVTRSEQS